MAETQEEAVAAVKDMLEGDAFGESGKQIVIEEMLYGEEASIHVIASGEVHLSPGQSGSQESWRRRYRTEHWGHGGIHTNKQSNSRNSVTD